MFVGGVNAEGITGGGKCRQPISPFSVNDLFSLKKKTKKLHNSHPSYFPISHVFTNFHYDQTNNKEKIWSAVTTKMRDDAIPAEKPLFRKALVLQILQRPVPTVFDLQS